MLALPGGGFIVTWTSVGQGGNGDGVYAQRYGADGARFGAEFRLNPVIGGDQHLPAMAAAGASMAATSTR